MLSDETPYLAESTAEGTAPGADVVPVRLLLRG